MTGREWGVPFFIHPSIHPFIHLFSSLSSLGRCWWWTWRNWHLLEKQRRWRRKTKNEKCIVNYTNLLLAWPLLHRYYISQLQLQRSPCLLMHCNFFCITFASPLLLSTTCFLNIFWFFFSFCLLMFWLRKTKNECIVNYTNLLLAWALLHQYYISQLKLQRSPCLLKHCNFFCITSIFASSLFLHHHCFYQLLVSWTFFGYFHFVY